MAIKVFISYSHKDRALRDELDIHLSNLKRQDIISSWYDGNIAPGAEWEPEIMERLKFAQIILLLISTDFIHSDFCYSIEMKQAMDRHHAGEARVIPILLRPTDWQGAPFDKLKMLPTDAKAVTRWRRRDDAFADVVRGIRAAIDILINTRKTANPSLASDITPVDTAQFSIWNVPYQRNPLFTGRQEVLKRLSDALKAGKAAALAQPQAISGLGGIGKTQTAVEYAYRYRHDYIAVLWVKGETEGSINSDFVTIANLLDLPEKQEQEQNKIIEAVKRWFQGHIGWLLILDNADNLAIVQRFLPSGGKGHVLLTTRTHATGRIAQRIEVEKMEPEEGALFLLHRATIIDQDAPLEAASRTDQDSAQEIVKAMDGLPLALEQAGAYIEETACGLQGYLRLYRAQGVQLLKKHGQFVPDHPEPVATTWSLSFEKVEQANAAAAELLRFCAFLAPDAIPEEMFIESAGDLGTLLEPVASDPFMLNEAIRELLKYSLVQRDPEAQTLSMHRLVQEVLKDQMDVEIQRQWAERTVRVVSRVFPDPEYTNRDDCRRYLLHAQVCNSHIVQWDMTFPEAVQLLNNAGGYLQQSFQYEEAELLRKRALAISERVLGPEHPDTAGSLRRLGYLYREQGKYELAELLFQLALAICEKVLGPEHPDTAGSLHGLAWLYTEQSKYEEAEPLQQRALAISERVLGLEHLITANSLYGLAGIYSNQGKYEQSESLYQHTLKIYENTLPPDNPYIADILENYARLLQKMKRNEEAATLEERVRAIRAKRSS